MWFSWYPSGVGHFSPPWPRGMANWKLTRSADISLRAKYPPSCQTFAQWQGRVVWLSIKQYVHIAWCPRHSSQHTRCLDRLHLQRSLIKGWYSRSKKNSWVGYFFLQTLEACPQPVSIVYVRTKLPTRYCDFVPLSMAILVRSQGPLKRRVSVLGHCFGEERLYYWHKWPKLSLPKHYTR